MGSDGSDDVTQSWPRSDDECHVSCPTASEQSCGNRRALPTSEATTLMPTYTCSHYKAVRCVSGTTLQ